MFRMSVTAGTLHKIFLPRIIQRAAPSMSRGFYSFYILKIRNKVYMPCAYGAVGRVLAAF
jgi:hypothetical protein